MMHTKLPVYIYYILEQDITDKILQLIPKTAELNQEKFHPLIIDMNKSTFGLVASMCSGLLVHATSKCPQTEPQLLKSALPLFCKALAANEEENTGYFLSIKKRIGIWYPKRCSMYKKKCQEVLVVEKLTGRSQQCSYP